MLIIGKNGTSGTLNVLMLLFCGCLQIIIKKTVRIIMKITNKVIA